MLNLRSLSDKLNLYIYSIHLYFILIILKTSFLHYIIIIKIIVQVSKNNFENFNNNYIYLFKHKHINTFEKPKI